MANPIHTAGPWHTVKMHNGDIGVYQTANSKPVAMVGPQNPWDGQVQPANARLVAAAPDLLAACLDAVDQLECNCGGECMGNCSKAIVQAAIDAAVFK